MIQFVSIFIGEIKKGGKIQIYAKSMDHKLERLSIIHRIKKIHEKIHL